MAFSEAQFQAVVDKVSSGLSDLSDKVVQIRPTAESSSLTRTTTARCGTGPPTGRTHADRPDHDHSQSGAHTATG